MHPPQLRYASVLIAAALLVTGCGREPKVASQTVAMMAPMDAFQICVHMEFPWSDYVCPDSSANRWQSVSDMDSVSLVVKTKAGVTRITPVPRGTDVIFMSRMSVDSILVRYYDATKAPEKARGLRQLFPPSK